MRIDDGGGRAVPPPPVTIEDEKRIMRQQQQQARAQQARQQQQSQATTNTNTSRTKATQAVDTYNGQVRQHQENWVRSHPRRNYASEAAMQQAWENDWDNSEEGRRAQQNLGPALNEYSAAVQNELRVSAVNARATPGAAPDAGRTAVTNTANDIRGRGQSGTDADNALDRLTTDAEGRVQSESPELQVAAINTDRAITATDAAAARTQDLKDRRAEALADAPRNRFFREEIAAGFDSQIQAAEAAEAQARAEEATAGQTELAVSTTDRAIAQQERALDSLAGKPGMMGERSDILRRLGELRQQRTDILNGKIDIRDIGTPTADPTLQDRAIQTVDQKIATQRAALESLEGRPGMMGERAETQAEINRLQGLRNDILYGQVDPRTIVQDTSISPDMQDMFIRHPELASPAHSGTANGLVIWDMGLQRRHEIDAAMDRLPQIAADQGTPQWMKDLIESDPVTAGFVVVLGVETVQPRNEAEVELAKASPITFAALNYLGVTYERPVSSADTPSPTEYANAGQQQVAEAFERMSGPDASPEDRARLQNLQVLMYSTGDARVSYVLDEWDRTVASESPEESLETMLDKEIDDEDYNDPDAEPTTEFGKFMQTLSTQLDASFMPEHQMQIWGAVGGQIGSYVDTQARILDERYDAAEDGSDRLDVIGDIGEWQQQVAQFAPAPVAQVTVDASTRRFDPAMLRTPVTGGRYANIVQGERRAMVEGFQLLADRAGPQAGKQIVDWALAPGRDAGGLPSRVFVTVKEDGTGATLGAEFLKALPQHGYSAQSIDSFEKIYTDTYADFEKAQSETVAEEQVRLFDQNRNDKLQEIFDGLLHEDREIFTEKAKFGTDPVADNAYGERLGLTADNPNAGPGEARYTDPEKLRKIHDFKQLDYISRGAGLDLNMDAIGARIARGEPLLDDEDIQRARQIQSWVREIGGDNAQVSFTPAVYKSKEQGVSTIYLMRVEGDKNGDGTITRDETTQTSADGYNSETLEDEDRIIDTSAAGAAVDGSNVPWRYDDFQNFINKNRLDTDGKLYLSGSDDLLLHDNNNDGRVDNINFNGVDAAITTAGEWVGRVGDVAIGIAAAGAAIAMIIGTGGTAAPVVALLATAYFGVRTAQTAEEMQDRGQSLNPFQSDNPDAWFGVLDPEASNVWLGAITTATGIPALRPLTLGSTVANLGRGATLADEAMLVARLGRSSTGMSRGAASNLFGRNGLQANVYRAGLQDVPWPVAWSAMISGGGSTVAQIGSYAGMVRDGQVDITDWSLFSPTWDVAMAGFGGATFAAGFHGARRPAPAPEYPLHQPGRASYVNVGDESGNSTLFAVTPDGGGRQFIVGSDGTTTVGRTGVDVETPFRPPFVVDRDGVVTEGEPPVDVVIYDTSLHFGPQDIHFFSQNRDGSYRYSTLGGEDAPIVPVPERGGMIVPPSTPDRHFNVTTLADPGETPHIFTPNEGLIDVSQYDLAARQGGEAGQPIIVRVNPTGWDTSGGPVIAETEARVRSGLAPWLDDDVPSLSDKAAVLDDDLFDDTFAHFHRRDGRGVVGFVRRGPDDSVSGIYVREGSDQLTLGHEYVHAHLGAEAHRRASQVVLDPTRPDNNLSEGFTELVTFHEFGPEEYRNSPTGFRDFVEHTAREHGIYESTNLDTPDSFKALGEKLAQIGFEYRYVPETLAVEYAMQAASSDAYRGFARNDMYALEEFIEVASDLFPFVDLGGQGSPGAAHHQGWGVRRRGGVGGQGSGDYHPHHRLTLEPMHSDGSGTLPAGDGIVVKGLSGPDVPQAELTTPIKTWMTPAEVALAVHRMATDKGENWQNAAFVVLDVQRPPSAGIAPLQPLPDNLGRSISYAQALANILGKPVAEPIRTASAPVQWAVFTPQQAIPLSLTPRYRSGGNVGPLHDFDQLRRFYVLGQGGKTRSPRQELGPILDTTAHSITFAAGDNLQVEIFTSAIEGPPRARQRFEDLGGQQGGAHLATALDHAAVVSPRRSPPPAASESLQVVLDNIIARGSNVRLSDVDNEYWARDVPVSLSPRLDPASGRDLAPVDFLQSIRSLIDARPEDADTVSGNGPESRPGIPHDAKPLLDAMIDDNGNPGYDLARAGDDSFHFLRAGARDLDGAQNIYINATPDHATKVMDFIVREIVDRPDVFDGVTSARILGPEATVRRVDNIVIEVETPAQQQAVLQALDAYRQRYPGYFQTAVPKMTDPVAPGISVADEPTQVMVLREFEALFTAGVSRADRHYTFGGTRRDAIFLAWQDTRAAERSATGHFDFASSFRNNVRSRFASFGIDPDNPARNLPLAPGGDERPILVGRGNVGDDHLAGVRPRTSSLGSWEQSLVSWYDRRVNSAADKAPPLIELYKSFFGENATAPDVSPFARQMVAITRHVRALFSIAHDVHAHPEGYDARLGQYYIRLMRTVGRYSEVLGCGIPQGCGVGHYTNPNSPPLSYAGAAALDARHFGEHTLLRNNYVKWTSLMRQVSKSDVRLAVQIDQATFIGDFATVDRLVDDAPAQYAFFRSTIKSLAREDPHVALNAHYAKTGFNPADRNAGRDILEANIDHYYAITGEGETTLQKEGVTNQLKISGEAFDFSNPAHIAAAARWLAVQKVTGKMMSIHSDWGIAKELADMRLIATTDHGYTMFRPLIDLVAPFAQDPNSSIILDHAGGGRYVNYDPTPMPTPGWLQNSDYGPTIPHQILKMEEARRDAPGVKFDISWNDNGVQFSTDPQLRQGLIQFIRRHPDAVMFGTDTVKPVNRSQYLQNLTTLSDFFVELAATDRELALNVLRRNFETMADRAVSKTMDARTLRSMADEFDQIASQMAKADTEPMKALVARMPYHKDGVVLDLRDYAQSLRARADALDADPTANRNDGREIAGLIRDGVVVQGPDGNPVTITIGRKQMRQSAEQLYHGVDFERISDTFLQTLGTPSANQLVPIGQDLHLKTGTKNLPVFADDSPQAGTGSGAELANQGSAKRMVWADAAAVAGGAAVGAVPFVGIAGGLARTGLFGRGLYRQEFARRLWESIFEDGRGGNLSLFAHETVKVARAMGTVPESRLAEFVEAMMQLDVDANYVFSQTAGWDKVNAPDKKGIETVDWSQGEMPLAHHAMMAVIGIGQISGDRALGMQASSLLHLDPRTAKGRRHNLYIATSSGASATGIISTTVATVAALPPGAPQIAAAVTGGIFSAVVSGTQAMMIWQRLWANRYGRGNINPELNDRFRNVQTRILAGIRNSGGAAGANSLTIFVTSGGNVWILAGNLVLDVGVTLTAEGARRIEKSRVNLQGGTDPEPSAKALSRVLRALGFETGATGGTLALTPKALGEWIEGLQETPEAMERVIDVIERGLDAAGW